MDNNKIGITRIIDKKKLLLFFVLFVIGYCLLNFVYKEILELRFSDVFKQGRNEDFMKISAVRLYELIRWQFLEPFILSVILSLICVYTKIFKKHYFKDSIVAFLIFIVALFLFVFLSKLYAYEREKSNEAKYKKLIIGKWHYSNRAAGNVTLVFSNNSTGYRFTDSIKAVQKFECRIKRKFLSIILPAYKSEIYLIDSLTTKTLIIRSIFKNNRKDNVYSSKFTRGSP